jgi:hypothetical protein
MSQQINELMALALELRSVSNEQALEKALALKASLEAALKPGGLMVDMVPPATARDRWMYEQGRLAERDPRSHTAPQAQPDAVKPGEPVYAFRRKGLNDFCTCDERRYLELQDKPHLFEVAIFYRASPPAQTPHDHGPQAETVAEAARDVGKWLNERPSRPLDLRHVAMLVAHVQTPPSETTPINEVVAHWDADLAQGQMAPEQAADFVRREREFAAAQAQTQTPVPPRLTDEMLRDCLRECPPDAIEPLRTRWLYAKDFARAIESAVRKQWAKHFGVNDE